MKASLELGKHPPGVNAEQPRVVIIQPTPRGIGLDVAEMWDRRELLYFLVWRDIRVRYKQTVLGAGWAVLQPVLTMLIFTAIFGRLARMPSDGVPYPVFVYAGLVPWTYFANAVTAGGNSLVGNAHLITKVYFPRAFVPIGAAGALLLDFFVAIVILAALLAYYRVALTAKALLLPCLVLIMTVLAIAIGMWLSALNVKYRDVRYVLPFATQVGMFLTPIVYPLSLVPEKWRAVLALNPMTGIVEGFRACLLGSPLDLAVLSSSAVLTVALLVYGVYAFKRMERQIADVV